MKNSQFEEHFSTYNCTGASRIQLSIKPFFSQFVREAKREKRKRQNKCITNLDSLQNPFTPSTEKQTFYGLVTNTPESFYSGFERNWMLLFKLTVKKLNDRWKLSRNKSKGVFKPRISWNTEMFIRRLAVWFELVNLLGEIQKTSYSPVVQRRRLTLVTLNSFANSGRILKCTGHTGLYEGTLLRLSSWVVLIFTSW